MDKLLSLLISFCITLSSSFFGASPVLPSAPVDNSEDKPECSDYFYDKIEGVNESCFYIGRPNKEKHNVIHSSDFGMSEDSADNTDAINSALQYCSENKGTQFIIDKGTYRFAGDRGIEVFNCENLLIDGNGSEFIFTSTECYEKIQFVNSKFVEIRNLNVDWDWENDRIGSVAEIIADDDNNNTMDLKFPELACIDENIVIKAMTVCDKKTLTMGDYSRSDEIYFYQIPDSIKKIEKIGANVLRVTHNGCADFFNVGQIYMVRHHVYDATIFRIKGQSNNLTFDGINIYGSSGMAFTAAENCSHFQIKNCYIGVDERYKDTRHISLGADAIHIADTKGYFNIEGCDISGMGDDAVNIHDNLGYVTQVVNDNTVNAIIKFNAGENTVVGFKDAEFNPVDENAVIKEINTVNGVSTITFDRNVADFIGEGYILFNSECNSGNYVIRNNYFHENRARGLLLQSPNGLCENNRFYKTMGPAIRVIMDIQTGLWFEGTGVDNLVIRNNEFNLCNYSFWGTVIDMGTNIDGKQVKNQPFTNITISDNKFTDCNQYSMVIRNANGIKIENNTVNVGKMKKANGKIRIEKSSYNFDVSDNKMIVGSMKLNSVNCEGLRVWLDYQISKLKNKSN